MINLELYHGSNYQSIKNILNNKKFNKIIIPCRLCDTSKKPGTLGFGLYAFERCYLARGFVKSLKNSRVGIISFNISVDEDKTLDLTSSDDLDLINYIFKRMPNNTKENIIRRFNNYKFQKSLEGAIIEQIIKILQFTKKQAIYLVKSASINNGVSNVYTPNGIEYCIKDNSIIDDKSIKLVYDSNRE